MTLKNKIVIVTLSFFAACSSGQGINYAPFDYSGASAGTSTYLTGIRGVTDSSDVYISGIDGPPNAGVGLLYKGPISGGGTWYTFNYPSSAGATVTTTALYGPNNGSTADMVQIVGNYATTESGGDTLGVLYQGPLDGSGTWTNLNPQSLETRTVQNTIAHSTMGGYVVGNYDTDLVTGKAFIYDITNATFFELTKTGAVSITAYGIWWNGGTSYTIAGGFSNTDDGGISTAYVVDWDSSTHATSNWATYTYKNQSSVITHFEGITTDGNGGYNLVADWVKVGVGQGAAFVNIGRTSSGGFGDAAWTDYAYPGATVTSGNTVLSNYVLGIYETGTNIAYGYVATIP